MRWPALIPDFLRFGLLKTVGSLLLNALLVVLEDCAKFKFYFYWWVLREPRVSLACADDFL